MSKMRKILALVLALGLVLGLAACGGTKENHTPGAATSDEPVSSVTPSTPASQSIVTPTSENTPSQSVSDLAELKGLSVFTYGRFMDDADVTKVKNAFDASSPLCISDSSL